MKETNVICSIHFFQLYGVHGRSVMQHFYVSFLWPRVTLVHLWCLLCFQIGLEIKLCLAFPPWCLTLPLMDASKVFAIMNLHIVSFLYIIIIILKLVLYVVDCGVSSLVLKFLHLLKRKR